MRRLANYRGCIDCYLKGENIARPIPVRGRKSPVPTGVTVANIDWWYYAENMAVGLKKALTSMREVE